MKRGGRIRVCYYCRLVLVFAFILVLAVVPHSLAIAQPQSAIDQGLNRTLSGLYGYGGDCIVFFSVRGRSADSIIYADRAIDPTMLRFSLHYNSVNRKGGGALVILGKYYNKRTFITFSLRDLSINSCDPLVFSAYLKGNIFISWPNWRFTHYTHEPVLIIFSPDNRYADIVVPSLQLNIHDVRII